MKIHNKIRRLIMTVEIYYERNEHTCKSVIELDEKYGVTDNIDLIREIISTLDNNQYAIKRVVIE